VIQSILKKEKEKRLKRKKRFGYDKKTTKGEKQKLKKKNKK